MVRKGLNLFHCLNSWKKAKMKAEGLLVNLRKQNISFKTRVSCFPILDAIPQNKNELIYYLQGIAVIVLAAYLFYNSLWSCIFLSPVIPIYVVLRKREAYGKKISHKTMEFSDGMQAVSFALNTGYSIENAFAEAVGELELLYGKESSIVREFRMMVNRIKRNENLEDIMDDYAKTLNIDDVSYFSEIFRYAKRSGGDIPAIIKQTTKMIREKSEVQMEIDTIISGRKMEQKIMVCIPLGILIYLRMTTQGFVDVLYGNVLGIIVMTLCLFIYAAAAVISIRIVDIKV